MIDKIKRDTEENWKKAINFIPKKDEVIIYDYKDTSRIKIGDGVSKINDLKFAEDITFSNSTVEDEILLIGE